MIAIIDYGLSNMLSIKRAVELFDKDIIITNNPADIVNADKIVLPGVGAFQYGMKKLHELGFVEAIREAHKEGKPILGICLGMQMLFDYSEEGGRCEGLGLIPGGVTLIDNTDVDGNPQDVPHIGWEKLYVSEASTNSKLFDEVPEEAEMYFVHSYEGKPVNSEHLAGYTYYGKRSVCSIVVNGNTIGCQFHPEKSGKYGLKLLGNFLLKI